MRNPDYSELLYITIFILILSGLGAIFWDVSDDKPQIKEPQIIYEESSTEVIEEQEPPTDEIECLAINTYHEARDQSVAGQLAVMHVVLNRVASPKFPDTICGVVTQGPTYVNWLGNEWPIRDQCQFSWYCDGMSDTATDIQSYTKIKSLAEYAITDGGYDYTEGATHYHADYVKPDWRKQFRRVTKIDAHIFYAVD